MRAHSVFSTVIIQQSAQWFRFFRIPLNHAWSNQAFVSTKPRKTRFIGWNQHRSCVRVFKRTRQPLVLPLEWRWIDASDTTASYNATYYSAVRLQLAFNAHRNTLAFRSSALSWINACNRGVSTIGRFLEDKLSRHTTGIAARLPCDTAFFESIPGFPVTPPQEYKPQHPLLSHHESQHLQTLSIAMLRFFLIGWKSCNRYQCFDRVDNTTILNATPYSMLFLSSLLTEFITCNWLTLRHRHHCIRPDAIGYLDQITDVLRPRLPKKFHAR